MHDVGADEEDRDRNNAARRWPECAFAVRELTESKGLGNILLLRAACEQATEVVSGFGSLSVPAERALQTAAARMAEYLASDAFVRPYSADRLLLPFAFAGGASFTTVKPRQHSLTAAPVVKRLSQKRCLFT